MLESVHIRRVSKDWVGYAVAKAPLPSELLRPPYDEAKRMDWVLKYTVHVPLLVTLVNQSGSEKHAVCIVNHAGCMLVLDSEETFGLKLSREALSYCCGVGETIKGVSSVKSVELPPPRKEKQVAKPSVGSGSPERKKQKNDSGVGPSSKPRPSRGSGGGDKPATTPKSKSGGVLGSPKAATEGRERQAGKRITIEKSSTKANVSKNSVHRRGSSSPSGGNGGS